MLSYLFNLFIVGLLALSIGNGDGGAPPSSGSGGGDDDFGCASLADYQLDVYATFIPYPNFLEWWADDQATVEGTSEEVAEVVIEEGEQFVEDLLALDVPDVYAEGNQGVAGLYDWFNQLMAYVVLDDGDEPTIEDLSVILEQIRAGETGARENCAEEVDALGGYILMNPDELPEEEELPEDPGDVDNNFL